MKPYNDAYTVKIYGDMSRADVVVLSEIARTSRRILEFGVGASSYIIHQNAPEDAYILHIDTDAKWRELTINNLDALVPKEEYAPTANYDFFLLQYDPESYAACGEDISKYSFLKNCPMLAGQWDLIIVDGFTPLRETFMREVWPMLSVGGLMIMHDSRREWTASFVANILRDKFLEIDRIDCHPMDSNLFVIKRGVKKEYFDWNKTEAGNNRENPLFTVMSGRAV